MAKVPRRELSIPQQRHLIRQQEEDANQKRIGDAIKKHFLKQDVALQRWAKPMK